MNPAQMPIAQALFAQWRQVRGGGETTATRPFSRDWEDLLDAAMLLSATDRREAEHDVRELAAKGWLMLKTAPYRSYLLERVALPLAQESRWCAAFNYLPPTDEDARIIREFAWDPALEFLRTARVRLLLSDLQALNTWIARYPVVTCTVPIKERSLEIFGDEKRLDGLVNSALFGPDKLTLNRLGCFLVPEPLAWKRGPAVAADQPVLVLENAATWHSYARWNAEHGGFSAVVYGCGNRFRESVPFLAEIFRELGGPRRVFYFGDLDAAGLRIPRMADERAISLGLSRVEPHLWSYWQLLDWGKSGGADLAITQDPSDLLAADLAWLGELGEPAAELLRSGRRLAQEAVGWELIRRPKPPYITIPPSTVRT